MAKNKTRRVKVGNLWLDPRNTRIPTAHQTDDQRALLHELVKHEDIATLAKSIAKLGLFPNELMVVMWKRPRYVVLEGNRRLAAIKLLLTPELAQKPAQVRVYRKLSQTTDLVSLMAIDVVVVTDRLEAAPIIATLHTKNPKRRWEAIQQARFYREMVEEGLTPAEVAERLAVTLGEVRNYLRSEQLYRVALTLEYSDEVREKLENRRFPLTTLDRFLESRIGQKFLGIKLDETLGFRGVVHPDRFRVVLAKVVTDVATVKGLTRRINNEHDFETYVSEVAQDLPKTRVRGSFIPALFMGEEGQIEDGNVDRKTPPKKRRRTRKSKSVVPIGFTCTTRQTKVRALFDELKKLDIKKQRNSSGVMLRVLLDVALWCFYKAQNLETSVLDHCAKGGKFLARNPEWTPSLRQLISYGVEKHIFPGMPADGYKSVRKLLAQDHRSIATIDTLNEYTHNPQVQPTEEEIRAVWERAEPMLEIILN